MSRTPLGAHSPMMDPFATLGIERRFDLDLPAVEKRHRELSRALHPDRYADAGASSARAALSRAVEVNEAWRAVRDPVTRAEALLALGGTVAGEGDERRASPALLLEAMELREALEAARDAGDLAKIEALVGQVDARRRVTEAALTAGFAAGTAGETLLPLLGELRFHRRFLDEVSAIEDAMAEARVASLAAES